jgi:cytochrome c oxidase subunit 2
MALAVVVILLVIGSLIFHFASPWYFTPIASNWDTVDFTVDVTFLVCGAVFVAVNLFTAYCVLRFRSRKSHNTAHYEPENKRLETVLTIVTAVGVAAMLTPGLFVWGDFVTVPDEAAEFEVIGKQWHWSFRLPGDDDTLGRTDVRHVSPDNPLGLDPADPNGQDDRLVLGPIMHLPVNQPVKALLRSSDVLHDFAVPQFRVKMDLVPGLVTYQWFTPIEPGTYEVLCEEHCGVGHFAMRGRVVVDEPAQYQTWLASLPTFAATQAAPAGDAAAGANHYAVCMACHGAQGEGNPTLNAPKIAGLPDWYLRRQLRNYQQRIRGGDPMDVYGAQMAPMAQTVLDPNALANVVAYIETLPDNPAPATVIGDAARGARLYPTCAVCHGPAGEGRWSTNAPPLAGMTDWYLARQLHNFKSRVRGGHPEDIYGDQMNMMAKLLLDDGAINDMVAYINSLR